MTDATRAASAALDCNATVVACKFYYDALDQSFDSADGSFSFVTTLYVVTKTPN